MPYATRSDVDLIFGKDNVERWADADNQEDAHNIVERIAWALRMAEAQVNDELRGGYYTIPFTAPIPDTIELITATIAGILLYDTRRVIDTDIDQLSVHRKNVKMWFKKLTSGQMILDKTTNKRTPIVADSSTTTNTTIGVSDGFLFKEYRIIY